MENFINASDCWLIDEIYEHVNDLPKKVEIDRN